MKKVKRMLGLCLACVLMVSVIALPASAANTDDTKFTYEWNDDSFPQSRYDYTPERIKQEDSPVYIKTVEYTLPYGGYYAMAMYKADSSASSPRQLASRSEYLIADYAAYIINTDNVGSSLAGKYALLRGHYSDRTYSWGNCTIKWSPDTWKPELYPSLN